jgi:hypothetical protein
MTVVTLADMTPAQREGWEVLLHLGTQLAEECCLIGGQLVWLHAQEHGVDPPRSTEDIDVLMDVRTRTDAIRRACLLLDNVGFSLAGISPDGIGHRFTRPASAGGQVVFDILAPDHLGTRSDLTTTPPARTVEVPGGRTAIDGAEAVEVSVDGHVGTVRRPPLLATIFLKAAATTIPGRHNPDRDWSDLAFLLCLVSDPIGLAAQLSQSEAAKLRRRLTRLLDRRHPAWRNCGDRADLGHTTLQFLIDS